MEFAFGDHARVLHVAAIDQRGLAIQHHQIVDAFQMEFGVADFVAHDQEGLGCVLR